MRTLSLLVQAPAAAADRWSDAARDHALCDRALQGDAAAWNELIRRHNRRVLVALLGRGIPMSRAQDIAQEAWLRLIQQQREGRLTGLALPALAVAQACLLAMEAVRRDRTEQRFVTPGDPDMADPGSDVESRVLSAESLARAQHVVTGCTESAQRVFALAYGANGLSHADIAQRVGLSLQRVRQVLCELRQRIRAEIEGDG